jgi:hypothetical protein
LVKRKRRQKWKKRKPDKQHFIFHVIADCCESHRNTVKLRLQLKIENGWLFLFQQKQRMTQGTIIGGEGWRRNVREVWKHLRGLRNFGRLNWSLSESYRIKSFHDIQSADD